MIVIRILEAIAILDVLWSVLSFIGAIPIGKPFITPRLPILVSVMLMLFQISIKKQTRYCNVCNRNLSATEITTECNFCKTSNPLKFIGPDGRIYYKCSNSSCKETFVLSAFGNVRTRFSKISPYGTQTSKKRTLHCKYCNQPLSENTIVNLSLYTENRALAIAYRETFFYHSFGAGCKNPDLHLYPQSTAVLKEIDRYYETATSRKIVSSNLTLGMIRIEFRASIEEINKSAYQFRIALSNNNSLKLKSSEGIVVLLDGKAQSIENKSLIDHFLLELSQLNTQSRTWSSPVLVGISANDVDELEEKIEEGFANAEEMEDFCKQFLITKNNEDIIHLLYNAVENVHFFIYRTGSARDNTESKIYNVIPPVQALLYFAQSSMRKYWIPDKNGFCPPTRGKLD